MTTQTDTNGLGNGGKTIHKQFVSAPLAAQTISGNVKAQVRASTSGSSSNNGVIGIRVVSNDGSTVLATLLSTMYASNYPMSSSLRNINCPLSTSLTSYSCSAGDRLVVEIGIGRSSSWGSGGSSHSTSWGEDSGTDLPENQTETAAYNPWIEFSNAITLQ